MHDQTSANDASSTARPQASSGWSRRRWLGLVAFLVLAGGIATFLVVWNRRSPMASIHPEVPLDGEFTVAIRAKGAAARRLQVDAAGAVPVRAGERMDLELSFNQPAYAYVLWLDARGRVLPLYPWNGDEIEIKDADQPPPATRPAKVVFSPTTISKGWVFDSHAGLETVVLLARRTPLGAEARLGTALAALPLAKLRLKDEVSILGLTRRDSAIAALFSRSRGPEEEMRQADEPLRALMTRWQDQFEMIRVVRFANMGE